MRERRFRHTVVIDFVEVEDAGDFYFSAETKDFFFFFQDEDGPREYLK